MATLREPDVRRPPASSTRRSGEVGRISRVFRDVLELEKLRTGAERLALSDVGTRELVGVALGRLADDARTRGVALEGRVDDLFPRCDRERVLRVLLHLLENALRASPRGAQVEVEVTAGGGGAVLFSVLDRGPGIDPREWPFLFDEAAAWTDPLRKGDGLGLSVCRAIVEAHGGRIWCESDLGAGTRFRFSIPPPAA